MNNTHETRATGVRHKCDTNATRKVRVRHECYMNDTSVSRLKNFDFDNDTSKHIFSYPYIYHIASKKLEEDEQFHSKNYLLKIPCSHAGLRLKSVPQKWNFSNLKLYQKVGD